MRLRIVEAANEGYWVLKERDGGQPEFDVWVESYEKAMQLVITIAQSQAMLGEQEE